MTCATPGGRGDVDLGLGLAVGGEEVVGRGRGHAGLPVLSGQAETDLGVDPETGGGVDLERLPPELTLPGLEHEGLAMPAPLRMPHEALAEGREAGTPGALIGHHRSGITHHPEPWRGTEDRVDVGRLGAG